ncbi:MAG: prepilin-type N-terminal cleavage/methylation domain-containing protein [Betaproteobacteria bacterium]|nr:MAG: prepilin-type N-terminal cleavage/methylation domain-containing protein [Betaproteobacteria bacterium]
MTTSVSNRPARGFTLIEVMITVAVIAILAAIALPAYQEQIRKSRRSAAQGVLMQVASREQQLFLDSRQYVAAANTAALASSNIKVTVQSNLTSAYGFKVETTAPAASAPTFTVIATPTGSQTADKCGTMKVDESNVKTATGCGGTW